MGKSQNIPIHRVTIGVYGQVPVYFRIPSLLGNVKTRENTDFLVFNVV